MQDTSPLSPDRPSTDPAQDLFGHAPFARTVATAIRGYLGSEGIVLALYGPWGSGKSTVLAYIQHELESGTEGDRPVVVQFNPWWFSGQEHLAKAFLGQLRAVLPAKYEKFRKFGDKLAEFSEALGGVGDAVGTVTGQGWLGGVFRGGARFAGRSPKDVPGLKQALSDLLLEQKKRVLVVIDDIDRLAPDEVRQLFTVIKALADFPYVTYLLAFDREVAAKAIGEQTGLPGERYLEKIIQVPFELPRPDRTALRLALFKRLDKVLASTPEGRFDSTHWANIFYSGLEPLISVPRDVVRLTNALSVTYPAVVGEVNPVDFTAIEALRVFLPTVYDAIRTAPGEFSGHERSSGRDRGESKEHAQAFHEGWLKTVPEHLRTSTKDLVERLFPRLESVWGNMHYGADSVGGWRRQLRVCAPEVFPVYFKLSLSLDAVSRSEIETFLASTHSSASLAEMLEAASGVKGADGVSKVPALLDRLMDHLAEIDSAAAKPIIEALLDVGDKLLSPADQDGGVLFFGNETLVGRIAYHVLKKVESEQRALLLKSALDKANALRCSQYLIGSLLEEVEKATNGSGDSLVTPADVPMLKSAWCARVKQLSTEAAFIDHRSVAWLVGAWRQWGSAPEAIAWWQMAAANDENLLKLIAAHASESRTQRGSDLVWHKRLRIDPRSFEPYGDVQTMAERVRALIARGAVEEQHRGLANQFLIAWERMKAGKNPDAFGFDED